LTVAIERERVDVLIGSVNREAEQPMPNRFTSRLLRAGWLPLAAAAFFVTPMAASADPPSAACDARVNDTPGKLVECIQQGDLMTHMHAFQEIADANPGPDGMPSRNSGEPGYKASVDYVAQLMREAGYDVTIQTYKFDYYTFVGMPTFNEVSPNAHDYVLNSDWGPGQSTGSTGALGAPLQPAGGIVIPPTPAASSTSGCTPADFSGFRVGRVALIQRGGCNFGVKIQNAAAAGAAGVVIFNEGNPGRTDLLIGGISDAAGNSFTPTIPVAFTTFAVGQDLLNQSLAGTTPLMKINIAAIVRPNADDYNVIAESKGGDKNHVLVVDAHLDAIYGAGMLDNATGSAAILDIAQKMKNVTPLNKLRFIWFGGEELGLLGSEYYVNNLTSSQASHIGYDLDADVFGTPNFIIGILDPAAVDLFSGTVPETFPNRVYKASQVSRDQSVDFFDNAGLEHEFLSPNGTDAISFNEIGIPASGLLTGQDCCKSQAEVGLFGGQVGNYEGNLGTFDGGCVDNAFRWCDNIDNVDAANLTLMSRAFANTVVRMAFDTKVMSASNDYVSHAKPKLTRGAARTTVDR
jgi:Peptidase family M28/PA domain